MRNTIKTFWLLASAMALSACATSGRPVEPPSMPLLAPVPPDLMQEPTTEQRVRAELFEPPVTPTTPSAASKTS